MTTVYNTKRSRGKQPLFFGEPCSTVRFDDPIPKLEDLTTRQISQFWRPEEIDLSPDRLDYSKLEDHEKHIFTSNLKYQTLMDSVQSRSPSMILLPICSDPSLETWISTWSFFETIHSRSYTHIIRGLYPNPSYVLDGVDSSPEIMERALNISKYYDMLGDSIRGGGSEEEMMTNLYLCLHAINALEGESFYVSFACSFAFAERNLLNKSANIVKLIARDEKLHFAGTQYILSRIHRGMEGDKFQKVASSLKDRAEQIYRDCVEQELKWIEYLFKDGSMVGMNKDILSEYLKYQIAGVMRSVGLESDYKVDKNPLPWMNGWLNFGNLQTTPQETELTSYVDGQVDTGFNFDRLKI